MQMVLVWLGIWKNQSQAFIAMYTQLGLTQTLNQLPVKFDHVCFWPMSGPQRGLRLAETIAILLWSATGALCTMDKWADLRSSAKKRIC